jgi:hypothetical protein
MCIGLGGRRGQGLKERRLLFCLPGIIRSFRISLMERVLLLSGRICRSWKGFILIRVLGRGLEGDLREGLLVGVVVRVVFLVAHHVVAVLVLVHEEVLEGDLVALHAVAVLLGVGAVLGDILGIGRRLIGEMVMEERAAAGIVGLVLEEKVLPVGVVRVAGEVLVVDHEEVLVGVVVLEGLEVLVEEVQGEVDSVLEVEAPAGLGDLVVLLEGVVLVVHLAVGDLVEMGVLEVHEEGILDVLEVEVFRREMVMRAVLVEGAEGSQVIEVLVLEVRHVVAVLGEVVEVQEGVVVREEKDFLVIGGKEGQEGSGRFLERVIFLRDEIVGK